MTAAALTPAQSRFIEEMGQFLGGYGMTPMAGRMWGWLLLCEPPEQTAAEIAEALQASRGAISGTARILTQAGFIRRTTKRGDRREYASSPTVQARLHEFRDIAAFIELEVPRAIDGFLKDRAAKAEEPGEAGRKEP